MLVFVIFSVTILISGLQRLSLADRRLFQETPLGLCGCYFLKAPGLRYIEVLFAKLLWVEKDAVVGR